MNGSTVAVSYISGSGKKARPPRPFRSLSVLRLLYEHMRRRGRLRQGPARLLRVPRRRGGDALRASHFPHGRGRLPLPLGTQGCGELLASRSVRGPLVFIFEEKGRGPVVRLRVGVAACGSAVFAGRLLHTTCCAGASSAPPHGVRRSHARLVSQDVVLPTDSISPPSLALHDCGGPRG